MTELRHEDFTEGGRDLVYLAGEHLLSEAHDIVFHHHDGDGWAPYEEGNTAELAQEARELIDRTAEAVKEARRRLAMAERPARLRAIRRQQRERHSRAGADAQEERER